jgi:hypothetical protein
MMVALEKETPHGSEGFDMEKDTTTSAYSYLALSKP